MFAIFLAIVTFFGFFGFIAYRLLYETYLWLKTLNKHYRPLRYGVDYIYRIK